MKMNQAELKLEIFRQIDSLSDEKLIEVQKKILQILDVPDKSKGKKSSANNHLKLKKLVQNPLRVSKINLLSRSEIYER